MMRLKSLITFPADLVAEGLIKLVIANGVYTFSFDPSSLSDTVIIEPELLKLIVHNVQTGELSEISLPSLQASFITPKTITASGNYYVLESDTFLRIKKTVPEGTNIYLPPASSRAGLELIVKDVAGNASSYNYNLIPSGSEKIDGLSIFVGQMNYQVVRLKPIDGEGYDVLHSG